jgi:hypothetical protein
VTAEVRDIYWRSLEDPGFEHLHLEFCDNEIKALGFILRKLDEMHLRIRYEISLGPDWQFRSLNLAASDSGGQALKRLQLVRDEDGCWQRDNTPLEALEGCMDVDIEVTPFTNSLPIRRLGLSPGDSREIAVAFVAFPSLELRKATQRYSCLEAPAPDGGRFRYENPASGFAAELAVDQDGLVLDYPDLFHRTWPR